MLTLAYTLIVIQILVGTLDNLLHHELTEKLPQRASAAREIGLHGARGLNQGVAHQGLAAGSQLAAEHMHLHQRTAAQHLGNG